MVVVLLACCVALLCCWSGGGGEGKSWLCGDQADDELHACPAAQQHTHTLRCGGCVFLSHG
jgi:hypothetical protein